MFAKEGERVFVVDRDGQAAAEVATAIGATSCEVDVSGTRFIAGTFGKPGAKHEKGRQPATSWAANEHFEILVALRPRNKPLPSAF
jgi:hypothetical protein